MCTFSTVLCAPRGSSVKRAARLVKIAVTACAALTVVAALIVTVQVAVPEQPPPLQPEKVEPAADAAVKVTEVPLANLTEQPMPPQTMPAGALVTVPFPAPALLTVSVKD